MTLYIVGLIFTAVFIETDEIKWWVRLFACLCWPVTLALVAREVYDKIVKEDGK